METPSANVVDIPSATPQKPKSDKVERYYAELDNNHIKAINSICIKNNDYSKSKAEIVEDCQTDERIYEFNYFEGPAELRPTEGHWIDVSVQSKCVGKIPDKDFPRVNALIDNDKIQKVIVSMYGGKYKEVKEDFDAVTDKVSYELERDETDRTVKVAIFLK